MTVSSGVARLQREISALADALGEPAPIPPAGPDTAFDYRQLTLREQFELDQLMAVTVPLHGEPPARPMTDAESARLAVLLELARIDDRFDERETR